MTEKSGLGGRSAFSTSAMWFDFDRDGLLDLLVCNYVKWSPEHDVFCSVDGKRKSYCTPEAYRGSTCWLFRNRGNGTFEDVTAKSGIFDTHFEIARRRAAGLRSRRLAGHLLIANDTQPNKLYRNLRNGTFEDVAVRAGVAFSEDGKARARAWAWMRPISTTPARPGIAITNFDNEMMALYRLAPGGGYTRTSRCEPASGSRRATVWASAARSWMSNLDGRLDLVAVNGHIDETVRNIRRNTGYAQPPHLFLNDGKGSFRDVASAGRTRFRRAQSGARRWPAAISTATATSTC